MGFQFIALGEIPNPKGTFVGISLAFESDTRFLKVTDFRGNPLNEVLVTVENSGGDFIASTNETGIAVLDVDIAGTVNIILLKEKTNGLTSFTYASDPVTKTVILQPRITE